MFLVYLENNVLSPMNYFINNQAEDQIIQGRDFSGGSLSEHSFVNCTFQNCNFTQCMLRNAKLVSCSFKDCNLSLLKMDGCKWQDIYFENCKIVGAEFFKCDKKFFSIKVKNSFLLFCNFAGLNMKQASFHGSKLEECYFTDTCLIEADFSDTDLSGTIFHNSDLSKANFCGSKNYAMDVRANKVKKAKFSFPEAMGLLHGFEIEIVKG